jgi:hypothetical protein
MYAGRGDGDTDLDRARLGVLRRLVREVLGRAEGVEADGVHGQLLDRFGGSIDFGGGSVDSIGGSIDSIGSSVSFGSSGSSVRFDSSVLFGSPWWSPASDLKRA